jgi:hypothetical protein
VRKQLHKVRELLTEMMWIARLIMLFSLKREEYWAGVQKGSNVLLFYHQDAMAQQNVYAQQLIRLDFNLFWVQILKIEPDNGRNKGGTQWKYYKQTSGII